MQSEQKCLSGGVLAAVLFLIGAIGLGWLFEGTPSDRKLSNAEMGRILGGETGGGCKQEPNDACSISKSSIACFESTGQGNGGCSPGQGDEYSGYADLHVPTPIQWRS